MNMKIISGIGAIIVIIAIVITIIAVPQNTTSAFFAQEEQTIKVGYLGPLTSSAASIGEGNY
ncbi:MAG: hypothetical protein NTY48_05060 [Candidatus Diapherotrites archaeon]|nr:hypothetical protein [Candidatus Diapherotrites archaeon]